jgi:hypothetical protein
MVAMNMETIKDPDKGKMMKRKRGIRLHPQQHLPQQRPPPVMVVAAATVPQLLVTVAALEE